MMSKRLTLPGEMRGIREKKQIKQKQIDDMRRMDAVDKTLKQNDWGSLPGLKQLKNKMKLDEEVKEESEEEAGTDYDELNFKSI